MNKKTLLILYFTVLSCSVAQACGPNFQTTFFANRYEALLKPNEGMFDELVKLYGKDMPKLNIPYNKNRDGFHHVRNEKDRKEAIERRYLSARDFNLLSKAREIGDHEVAVTYLHEMDNQEAAAYNEVAIKFPFAYEEHTRERFAAVPEPSLKVKNQPWRLWALFNIARGDLFNGNYAEAVNGFKKIISLVEQGLDDPQHVAAGSLGYLATAYSSIGEHDLAFEAIYSLMALGATDYKRRMLDIIKKIIRWNQAEGIEVALKEPLTRSLMAIFVFTHYNHNNNTEKIFDAFINLNEEKIDYAHYLANFAYEEGLYEQAEQLAQLSDEPLAKTILAKLALRKDNVDLAAKYYADILQPLKQQPLTADTCTMLAESAVMLAIKGDIIEAFETLILTGGEYWQDVAYMAEKLLTIDELTAYVDQNTALITDEPLEYFAVNNYDEPRLGVQKDPWTALNELLARRLLREGYVDQAVERFHGFNKKLALNYQALYIGVEQAPDKYKAMKLWNLAQYTRKYGDKILAYEVRPDYKMYYLNYAHWGAGESEKSKQLIHAEEQKRFNQYNPSSVGRFSYRWMAAEKAALAADYVDPKSPTYEALLCKAANWVINRDHELAWDYFMKFRQNAHPTKDRKYFGKKCQEPKFEY